MERDFMGLNSKESVVVKEELVERGCVNSGFSKSSEAPLSLSNKVSVFPQFMSLKSEQDENPSKINSDLLASHGYSVKSGSDPLECIRRRQSGDIHESFVGGTMKQQLPPVNPAPVVGTTELWTDSKPFSASPQLTIFYDGSVNVFDGIPPETAEAIFLLAATGFRSNNLAQPKFHLQASAPKPPAANQPLLTLNMPPHSGLPSPISVSSHAIDHSLVPAAKNNGVKVSDTAGMPTTLGNNAKQLRVMPSVGSKAASAIISSVVPQARKASLARFLEKRKERVMSASPYNLSKKAADSITPDSNGIGFSATSGASSTSVSVSSDA